MADNDYYTILEIDRKASPTEIKKAYHKCAQKYHPDKNPNNKEYEEKFKQCSEAYEILIDPQKKDLYDKFGKQGLQNNHFSNMNIFNNFFGNRQQQTRRKTDNISLTLPVTLAELYHGTTKNLEYKRYILCITCSGSGSNKSIDTKCDKCGGSGQSVTMVKQHNTVFQTIGPCQQCGGKGSYIKENDKCEQCLGKGLLVETKILKIEIEPGMHWDLILTFFGEANEAPKLVTGDVLVTLIKTDNDTLYERRGDDLLSEEKITFLQAITGNNIIINHINGNKI